MNLYKILFTHTAPKDTKEGIETYLLAKNDEEVYNYIDREYNYDSWKDNDDENEMFTVYDDRWEVIGTETFKEKVMRLKGEMNDEEYDYRDAFYGITLYGWELVKQNINENLTDFIGMDIVRKIAGKEKYKNLKR